MHERGLLFGCFDPLHHGHESLFRRCKEHCRHLTVVVHPDSYIRAQKHREPFHHEDRRCTAVYGCEGVDDVALGGRASRAEWAAHLKADVVFLSEEVTPGRLGIPETTAVIHMPRTPGVSSTAMRRRAGCTLP